MKAGALMHISVSTVSKTRAAVIRKALVDGLVVARDLLAPWGVRPLVLWSVMLAESVRVGR